MKMRLPQYPRQSGARLRGFGDFGAQEGPCWTQNDGSIMCPAGYHVDSQTGRVVSDTASTSTDWTPVVAAGTGLVTAIVNAATGKQYNYPQGQQPQYQAGYRYSPPWYETIPTWAWIAGGGVLVGLAVASRRR